MKDMERDLEKKTEEMWSGGGRGERALGVWIKRGEEM